MRAGYLRYSGLQEFDRTMQHLEEKYGVCFFWFCKSLLLLIILGMHPLCNII